MTLPTASAVSPRTPAARPRRYCLHASRLRAWVIGAVVLGPQWTTPFYGGEAARLRQRPRAICRPGRAAARSCFAAASDIPRGHLLLNRQVHRR